MRGNLSWFVKRATTIMSGRDIAITLLRRVPGAGRLVRDRLLDNWEKPHPFDVQYGISTSGFLSARELRSGKQADLYNIGYAGCQPSILRQAIRRVEGVEGTTFIDLGCGKGRALVVASEFPFRAVIGVELAPELCTVARANAAAVARHFPNRPPITVIEDDAAAFAVPPGDLVLYLNRPFHELLLEKLVAHLERATAGRQIHLIFGHPRWEDVVDRSALFRRLFAGTLECDPGEAGYAPSTSEAVIIYTTSGRGTMSEIT